MYVVRVGGVRTGGFLFNDGNNACVARRRYRYRCSLLAVLFIG